MKTTNMNTKKTAPKNIKIAKPKVSGTEKVQGPRDCFPLG